MQRVARLDPLAEVSAPVQRRDPPHVLLGAHHQPPVSVGSIPRCRGITERAHVDAVVGGDDGVVLGLDPLAEEGVGEVGRVPDVLHLVLIGVDAGVHDDRDVVGQQCRGARPAAVDVEGPGRVDRGLEGHPVDEVGGDGVRPDDVPPHGAPWVVLVEEVVQPLVVHWPIGIIDPVLGGLEMVAGAQLRGDLLGLQRLELRVDDVRRLHRRRRRPAQQRHDR